MKWKKFLYKQLCEREQLFICKAPVLASFANGRPTSLVIEAGHHFATVTPVHDGYAIQKSIMRAPVGGAFLHA